MHRLNLKPNKVYRQASNEGEVICNSNFIDSSKPPIGIGLSTILGH